MRSKLLRIAVSMPSASTSTLSMPSASMSSLSHSMKVRSFMAPLRMGTVSSRRSRVSTKPPTCCDRWRGKPISSEASPMAWRMAGLAGSRPASRMCWSGMPPLLQTPHGVGERRRHILLEAQRAADLADGHARAVVDDGRADGGALAAVAVIEMLDDLLAPLVLEIDIDIGWLACVRARGSARTGRRTWRDRWTVMPSM